MKIKAAKEKLRRKRNPLVVSKFFVRDEGKSWEDMYPRLDKRRKGYIIEGFIDAGKRRVPVWTKVYHDTGKKYTGEILRSLRAERLKNATT